MAKAKSVTDKIRHDPVLERLILGAILTGHTDGIEALDILSVDDFFHPDHRELFATLLRLHEQKVEIGISTLYIEIEKLGDLRGENLLQFLRTMDLEARGTEDFSNAIRELRRLGLCRMSNHILETARMAIEEGDEQIDEILDTTVERLSESIRKYEEFEEQGITFRAAADQTIAELMQSTPVAKIYTGVTELDEMTGGFRPGELVILTAETGSGKTLLAQQTRFEACERGYISLFCSGEMWARHLLRRELAAAAGVNPALMRREDRLSAKDFSLLIEAAGHQCEYCRILDGELSIGKIRRAARALKARHKLHLLIIDYDELVESPGKDENEQLRRLVRASKSIGMELDCAVILISQLRKEYGGHDDKKDSRPPSLSRIYGSGAKTKHASLIILAERKWEEKLEGVEKEAILWVMKNRDGRTGPVKATFNLQKLRFESHPDSAQGHL